MAKKILTKEIASALKEGLDFEEFLKKEKLTEKDVNVKLKPFYVKAYPVFKEIIEKFKNGTSMAKLGKEYGLSDQTIMKYLESLGYERPLANPELKWFEDNKQLVIDLYNKHKSLTVVAKIIKADRNKLVKKLKALGVEIDYSANDLKNFDQNFFEKIDTDEKAYWFGFIYADGWVVKKHSTDTKGNQIKKYSLNIELSSKDKSHLIKFAKTICLNFEVSMIKERERVDIFNYDIDLPEEEKRKYKTSWFQVCSKKIVEDLIKLGCIPNKTLTKTFPTYNEVPEELMGSFIRGYFDGNGYILEKSKQIGITSGSEKFLEGLLSELKKQTKQEQNKITSREGTNTFHVYLGSGSRSRKVFDLMYNEKTTVYLERKYLKFIK